eukprot:74827-Hanusia_phi.AAC.1
MGGRRAESGLTPRRYFLFFMSPITIFSLDVILQLGINIMFSFYIFQDEKSRRHSLLEVSLAPALPCLPAPQLVLVLVVLEL